MKSNRKNDEREAVIGLTLIFVALFLSNNVIWEVYNNMEEIRAKERIALINKYNIVSAKAVSGVKENIVNGRKTYSIDVDFDNNGTKDRTVTLIDNVKYVSPDRSKKIKKINKDSKLMFEFAIDCDIRLPLDKDGTIFPVQEIKSISGENKLGLIDNLFVIDGEVVDKLQNSKNRREFALANGNYEDCSKNVPMGKIDENVFESIYLSNFLNNVR